MKTSARADRAWVALAAEAGIEPEYVDGLGTRRVAGEDALRAVLTALGIDARDPRGARSELARLRNARAPMRSDRSDRARSARCVAPPRGRSLGVLASLYTVRGAHDRGFGDLGALRELVERAAAGGFDFVGVNPLHATSRRDPSPYSPVSRRYRAPQYVDPRAVPEYSDCGAAQRKLGSRRVADLAASKAIDHAAVRRLSLDVLGLLHARFRERGAAARAREFKTYRAREGEALVDFATFLAIEEAERKAFDRWPAGLRDPRSREVAAFRRAHGDRVDFHAWVQFEAERQWLAAAALAKRSGMRLGLYSDLAVGSAPDSADVWMRPREHVAGVALGAPPDLYAREGQVWGFPPLHPLELAATGGAAFESFAAAAMRGAGAVRVDHAIGLVRQYWVPRGARGTEGVMVRMPAAALFGALVRASRAHRCVVVAEDLGTVPKDLPARLARHGILSSRVLLFERESDDLFRTPASYPRASIATAATHDLPPLAGWLAGRDLAIRRSLGMIAGDREARRLRRERARTAAALRRLAGASPRAGAAAIVAGVHAALAGAGSALVGLALDDLALETEPVNVPNATADLFPVWSRRMRLPLAAIAIDAP